MNPTETKGVLALLRAAYPNFYKDMPRADLLAVVNLWQKQFEEFDGSLVLAAVNSLISSRVEGFPPTIGAVKEQILSAGQRATGSTGTRRNSKNSRRTSAGLSAARSS